MQLTGVQSENCYLTLKAHTRTTQPIPEVEIAKHLNGIKVKFGGEESMRLILDSFQVKGPHGMHPFLLYRPAGMDVTQLLYGAKDMALPIHFHRYVIHIALLALNYLHETGVIHTGKLYIHTMIWFQEESF